MSTAPVEYESQEGEFDFEGEIARLRSLRSAIGNAKSVEEKLAVVDGDSRVKRFFCSGKSGVFRVYIVELIKRRISTCLTPDGTFLNHEVCFYFYFF